MQSSSRAFSPVVLLILCCAWGAAAQRSLVSAAQAEQLIMSLLNSSTPAQGISCSFNIEGNFTKAMPSNTTGSTNVNNATIACTGGTLRIVGGPALKPFLNTFSGVEYTVDNGLPGATLSIRNQSVTLSDSSFKNLTPNGEACLIFIRSNITIQHSNFSSNKQATAGAIRANDTSNIAIFNSTFLNNTGANAGAISVFNSSLFVNGSTFTGNTGQQGGGILFQNGSASALRIASSVFMNNNATTGGGTFAQDCAQAILYNNIYQQNRASGSGGGIFQLNCGGAIVLNLLSKNNATAGGAAYINNVAAVAFEHNMWNGNTASIGAGGVDLQSVGNSAITNDTFMQNRGQQGGAYFGTSTACKFTSCTFEGNNATLNGGGVFRTQGSGDISFCLFKSNSAGKLGGGVYDSQVSGDITNSMFETNSGGSSNGAAVFRLQSAGDVDSNTGLSSGNFVNQLPNATSGGVTVAGR